MESNIKMQKTGAESQSCCPLLILSVRRTEKT
jgi:hypothetical protein